MVILVVMAMNGCQGHERGGVMFDGVGLGPVRYRSEFRCSSCVFQVQFVVFW